MMDMNFALRLLGRGLIPPEFLVQRHRLGKEIVLGRFIVDGLVMHDLLAQILDLVIARLQKFPQLDDARLEVGVVLQDVAYKMTDDSASFARLDALQSRSTL
jgi:hypothetical protein